MQAFQLWIQQAQLLDTIRYAMKSTVKTVGLADLIEMRKTDYVGETLLLLL